MKEIGGYFGLDQLKNENYHENMIELNTGRNALIYLVKAKKIRKIYLPYYLCDSVADILEKYAVVYENYHIDKDFMPIFKQTLNKNEYIYIVNYYGQITDDKIKVLKEEHNSIIMDNTQAFYQKSIPGVDTIYSCRKFLGVPDGAYLSTDTVLEGALEVDTSMNRMRHVLGRYEGRASDYYADFQKNDASFRELPLKKMSNLTRNILGAIEYEKIRIIRNENFKHLHENLNTSNVLDLMMPEGAFAYPYYVKNGIELRGKLAERKIYIPTLWPNVLAENNDKSIEYDYAANILPLPCDQRYGVNDMEVLLKELRRCLKIQFQ